MIIEQKKTLINSLKLQIDKSLDSDEIIKLTEKLLTEKLELFRLINKRDEARAGVTAKQLINEVNNMKAPVQFLTGIPKIDSHFGGFASGLFINLAGQSFAGKTTMLLFILSAISQAQKTVFFSLEMSKRNLVGKIKKLKLNETQLQNLIIDSDTNELSRLILEISLYADEGVKFFAIDSKMKIKTAGEGKEYQEISNMSKELALLCARKDITIFLINQMSEEDIKHKRLAFKGSGDQIYDSDIALFLIRDDKTDERKLICTKNRTGEQNLFNFVITESDYSSEPEIVEYQIDDVMKDMF